MSFFRNWVQLVSHASWFIGLGTPQASLSVWPRQAVGWKLGEKKFHILSALILQCWPAHPRKYTRITWFDWFHQEADSGSSFRLFSVPSVCEGVIFAGLGENKIYKSKIQNLIPIMEFITTQKKCFSSNLPQFLWNFSFQVNLAEKSIFSIFKTIYGFCSSLRMGPN